MKESDRLPAVVGITCDSREVKPGYAFVAITGFNEDGNKYITEAVNNGAKIIYTDKKIDKKIEVPIVRVRDARSWLGHLAASYYNFPSKKIQLIGITGTNGKTTTTHLIYNLLNHNYYNKKISNQKAGLIGTVKIDTGSEIYPGNLTTPDSVKLQQYLNDMVTNKLKYACMEVSSHGIKLKRIAGTEFAIKVGTNISIDHFDLHPNFADYLAAKKSFLQDNQTNLVLINYDDVYLKQHLPRTDNLLSYAINSPADIKAVKIISNYGWTNFSYQLDKPLLNNQNQVIKPGQFPISMQIFGKHNIYNALVAITIALYYEQEISDVQDFFYSFKGVWRRLQVIYKKDITIIDDCAHNPGSYQAVFQAISEMNYNRLIIINSLRGNRGLKINRENAITICDWLPRLGSYQLITTNCNDVVKKIDQVSQDEEEVFLEILKSNQIDFQHIQNLNPALEMALNNVSKGDLILLLGPHAMDKAGKKILDLM